MCKLVSEEEIDSVFRLPHFNIIKKLQLLVGLWPYYSKSWKFCVQTLLYSILFTAMIPLCNGFRIWCGVDLDICGENILGIIYTAVIFFKYWLMSRSTKKLKRVYERLASNWLMITKPDERAIMLSHAKVGKMYSIIIIVLLVNAGFCFSQIPAVPVVLDAIFPLNESRPKILFVRAEFIIDPYEHFSKLYLYFLVATVLTVASFASIDATYCTIVYQILGIMHRLIIATQSADNSYGSIVSAISLHQESLIFVKLIEGSCNIAFLIIIVGTTMFISMGVVVRIIKFINWKKLNSLDGNFLCEPRVKITKSSLILNGEYLIDFVRFLPMEIGAVVHIFYLSLTAQKIIDYSNDLFTTIYMTEWYKISAKSKKLLKYMMLRTSKPCVLTAGGFYVMSLQNFGKIIRTTLSYVTVLSSFR